MALSGSESTTNGQTESIWTRTFMLLCAVQFFGYAQHFVLQPTFPLYITHLGGSPVIVGLVIASFGVASVVSRPVIRYLGGPRCGAVTPGSARAAAPPDRTERILVA